MSQRSLPGPGRSLMVRALGLAAALIVGVAGCARPEEPGRPPDIVLVTWDSVRADHVSAYGYERPTTPTLDGIARQGVLFETAIAQHNWTWPSYASILTSRHNWEFPGLQLTGAQLTLPEVLQDSGYRTLGFVQNPVLSPELHFDQGFDSYVELDQGAPPQEMTRAAVEALDMLEAAGERPGERPLFLFVHYQEPHWPYGASPRVDEFLRPGSIPVDPDTIADLMTSHGAAWDPQAEDAPGKVQYILDLYDADIRVTDDALAELVEGLRARGRWAETLFVFISDHGDEFNDRGRFGHAHRNVHPELVHVPLIFRFPESLGIEARRVPTPVQALDVFPTLLHAAGIAAPDDISGESLLPLERLPTLRRLSFSNMGEHVAVRDGRRSLTVDLGRKAQYRYFDLERDPNEEAPLSDAGDEPAFRRLRRAAELWHETLLRNNALPPAEEPTPLSDDLIRRLRALGYVQ